MTRMILMYAENEIAVPTINSAASQTYQASTAVARIKIFPVKPAVGGSPASASKKNAIAAAAHGLRGERPANATRDDPSSRSRERSAITPNAPRFIKR